MKVQYLLFMFMNIVISQNTFVPRKFCTAPMFFKRFLFKPILYTLSNSNHGLFFRMCLIVKP